MCKLYAMYLHVLCPCLLAASARNPDGGSIQLLRARGSTTVERRSLFPQPSNFLMLSENPLTRLLAASAAADTTGSAAPAPSLAALRGSTAGPAASYDRLTGAFMSAAKADGSAETSATERSAADWPVGGGEGQYTGGWLKGIDFGCSNEVAPGTLLCKMTVRSRCLFPPPFASRAEALLPLHP